MAFYEQYIHQLKQEKLSLTKPRRIVFEVIAENHGITMAELVNKLTPTIHRASVYRTVKTLEDYGIVKRVFVGWKYTLELTEAYDNQHHHHLHCTNCNKTIHTDHDIALERVINDHARKYGFSISNHEVDIQGLCQSCRNNL
jgi:Fur family transcriptional regulator, ferric uptake regulator